MRDSEWETLLKDIIYLKEKIDKSALPLIDGKRFFYSLSVDIPSSESDEFNFFRAVSFLYVLYFEAGGINIKFVLEKLPVYKLDVEKAKFHLALIQKFRTYLQHNLDLSSPRDNTIKDAIQGWFKKYCGYVVPFKEFQWNECLKVVMGDAKQFLQDIESCIVLLQNDESCELISKDWCFRLSRHHPPFEFDNLVPKVASDMGRENIDLLKFRIKSYDSWVKKLSQLEAGYDFELEGRKVIEYSLLAENIVTLPITGKDIMSQFEIGPGHRIGQILAEANKIYKEAPCTKEEILSILSERIKDGSL